MSGDTGIKEIMPAEIDAACILKEVGRTCITDLKEEAHTRALYEMGIDWWGKTEHDKKYGLGG